MKLSTENIKLNLHVHGLLYLIIYIRASNLNLNLYRKNPSVFLLIIAKYCHSGRDSSMAKAMASSPRPEPKPLMVTISIGSRSAI